MQLFTHFKKMASFICACLFLFSNNQLSAQKIFALSGGNLVSFDAAAPASTTMIGAISGVSAGQMLAGIDFRPQTGELYGIGYNSSTGEARIYTLNLMTASATAIGAAAITVAPNMGDISFDFNPTVDRIRFMGSNKSNYRLHPVTGAIAATDGNLAFAAADLNAAASPEIGTGAYLNSYIASTATTLLNYDRKLNVLTSQNPPNNGTQNTIGASGITVDLASGSVSMDVFYNSTNNSNQFFLAANPAGSANDDLFSFNNMTGAATLIGTIGMPLRDIAVQIVRNVPALTGDLAYALTSNNWLISFDALNPGIIRTAVSVTGIAMGQVLSGLDFRPATGELFGLGYNATNGESRLYTIKTNTAAATAVGAAAFNLAPNLGKIGLDFNPAVDRIRVTSSSNNNYRLNPITGGLAATDLMLNFVGTDVNFGKNPSIGASAYINSFSGTTATTLFNYDDSLNVLAAQTPPNDGKLNTIGSSGVAVNLADPTSDLDVFYDKNTSMNRGYLMANTGISTFDNLHTINTMTGAASLVGRIGNGSALVDLAIFNAPRVAITCPANITLNATAGAGGMVATYTVPTAVSGCNDGLNGMPVKTSGLASGAFFSGGVNTVCFTATDNCGNSNSCCFTVTVNETPCDTKIADCIKLEMLSVKLDANNNKIMRVRVTNNCASPMVYAAFAVQNGTKAVGPANNFIFTANSGNQYTVRNPNFSPFVSIKFSSIAAGIVNGQSDVFEYVLPKVTSLQYHKVVIKTFDGVFNQAYLSINNCSTSLAGDPNAAFSGEDLTNQFIKIDQQNMAWEIFPNPSSGQLMADFSVFSGNSVEFSVFNLSGKLMGKRTIEAATEDQIDFSEMAENWQNGLYFVEIRTNDGQRQTAKWMLQR
jgi:Domain of unknown function (DUF4394)/HYR domain/Secretion system C-terminal sorting domain